MANAFTTNLNLTKPEVGADSDAWGGHLNTDLDALDALLAGVLYGLTLSAAGATATFGIAAGAASGMTLASAYTKTAGSWAVGTGNGSLDTGSIANSSWYHVWLIQRSDTGVVDVLTSLSASAPTMPTNYDRKRRIGSMKTDGSAQWVKFTQNGDEFLWDTPVFETQRTPATDTPTLYAMLAIPTGVKVSALMRIQYGSGSSAINDVGLVSSPNVSSSNANTPTSNITHRVSTVGGFVISNLSVQTDTFAQLRFASSNGSNSFYSLSHGWNDVRGKG